MKILRFKTDKVEKKGILIDGKIRRIFGSIFSDFQVSDEIYELDKIDFLPPILPSKIICAGRNYSEHAEELGNKLTEEPLIFLKPPTAIIAHNRTIIKPSVSERVDYEGELAVIIGKRCKNIPPEQIYQYIFGYTCFNDITARDIQKKENKFTRAKSFDTFAPIGPFIVTDLNAENLNIKTRVNNKLVQNGNTKNMIFKIPFLISFISKIMTLLPGDVVATGTPSGVGPLSHGDMVEVEIDNIGILKNFVNTVE